MRAPVSWVRELVDLPADVDADTLARRLTALGLKLEAIERPGEDLRGPLVLGRVLSAEPEPQKNGKTINWCSVDVGDANGTGEPQGIVCGAHNFGPGDLVVVVLPGAVLPGDFAIAARKTYGHVSAGMICSAAELALPADAHGSADGIVVLPPEAGEPGEDARGVLGLDEEVLDLEINPDRAYALSVRGIARDAALAWDLPASALHDPCLRDVPPADDLGHPVRVEDPQGCPVLVARTVAGVDPAAPTPDFVARRLALAGMRSVSVLVDVTNYVMLETGQPIHGYDADLVRGTLGVRRAREGEQLTTLDGTERLLSVEDLVVVDDSGPIGLGGVMGGRTTEMSATTTRVLVESAHWDATTMFRTGRRHRITSEAGRRNERGVDPTICEAAADRVVELLVAYAGGRAEPGVTVVGRAPQRPPIALPRDLAARISGMDVDETTAASHLRAVGCEVADGAGVFSVVPPPWRPDLVDPYDLVEEVARVVGYDTVPSVLPTPPAGRGLTREQRLRRRVGRTLAGNGHVEVVTFPFVGTADLDRLGLPADDDRRRLLGLANPLSAERPAMTTTLLPGLLETLVRNVGRGAGDVAIFETATVTLPHGGGPTPIHGVAGRPSAEEVAALDAALPRQPLHLAVAMTGRREREGWWGPGRVADWSDAVASVRAVAGSLGLELAARPAALAPWHPGRCAQLLLGSTTVGHAGELHPRVCRDLGLPARAVAAEVDLDLLLEHAVDVVAAPAYSDFPVAKEDVALVVDDAVAAHDVADALRRGAGELLESLRLFDVYTGEQVGPGRRSLAFALRFRAPDRTLTEEETGAARDAAVAAAAEACGATQR